MVAQVSSPVLPFTFSSKQAMVRGAHPAKILNF